MTGRINRCSHCGCDEPMYNAIDGKLYCNNCGMSLEKLEGGLTMAENKMAKVAELFGKKLGEKFKIYRVAQRDRREIIHGKFTERGLLTTCCLALEDDYDFDLNDLIMRQLLTGKAEIVEDKK